MHIFSFCFGLSLLNGSSHVHTFSNVKLNDHTPIVYTMFKLIMENKQYGTSFEVASPSQTKLQFQKFPHAIFLSLKVFKQFKYMAH
jgi:hypothetical protein